MNALEIDRSIVQSITSVRIDIDIDIDVTTSTERRPTDRWTLHERAIVPSRVALSHSSNPSNPSSSGGRHPTIQMDR